MAFFPIFWTSWFCSHLLACTHRSCLANSCTIRPGHVSAFGQDRSSLLPPRFIPVRDSHFCPSRNVGSHPWVCSSLPAKQSVTSLLRATLPGKPGSLRSVQTELAMIWWRLSWRRKQLFGLTSCDGREVFWTRNRGIRAAQAASLTNPSPFSIQ